MRLYLTYSRSRSSSTIRLHESTRFIPRLAGFLVPSQHACHVYISTKQWFKIASNSARKWIFKYIYEDEKSKMKKQHRKKKVYRRIVCRPRWLLYCFRADPISFNNSCAHKWIDATEKISIKIISSLTLPPGSLCMYRMCYFFVVVVEIT